MLMKKLNKNQDSHFLSVMCSFIPKATFKTVSFTSLQQKVSRPSLLCRLYFHFVWDTLAQCGSSENGILLMFTLEGVSSVENFIIAYKESK